jgi:hypothetical protein
MRKIDSKFRVRKDSVIENCITEFREVFVVDRDTCFYFRWLFFYQNDYTGCSTNTLTAYMVHLFDLRCNQVVCAAT